MKMRLAAFVLAFSLATGAGGQVLTVAEQASAAATNLQKAVAALDKAREALSPDGVLSEEAVLTAHRVAVQDAPGTAPVRSAAPAATYTNEFARRAKLKFQA